MQLQGNERLMLVDSFALLFRGYYATAMMRPPMPNAKGLYTNGLQQFLRYLFDAVKTFSPTHVICALDMGRETFRNQLYPQYKANRGEPPAELVPQFDLLRKVLDAYEIPFVGIEGYEADDMLGSMADHYANQGVQVQILSGDGDVLQLLRDNVEVILMKKGFSNYQTVNQDSLEPYNGLFRPQQVVEMKALMGDASDNIPGCPSVGPKTATKLIRQYDSVDHLYANIDDLQGKLKDQLLQHRTQVELSRELASIRKDIHFECCWDSAEWRRDIERTRLQMNELGMNVVK